MRQTEKKRSVAGGIVREAGGLQEKGDQERKAPRSGGKGITLRMIFSQEENRNRIESPGPGRRLFYVGIVRYSSSGLRAFPSSGATAPQEGLFAGG